MEASELRDRVRLWEPQVEPTPHGQDTSLIDHGERWARVEPLGAATAAPGELTAGALRVHMRDLAPHPRAGWRLEWQGNAYRIGSPVVRFPHEGRLLLLRVEPEPIA